MGDVDSNLVRAIAGQVMAALRAGPVEIHSPIGQCTGDYSKFPELKHLRTTPAPATTPMPAPSIAAPIPVAETVLKGVISVARLRSVKGPMRLAKGAMLTPLAQDYLRDKNISLISESTYSSPGTSSSTTFFQASAPQVRRSTHEVFMAANPTNVFQLKQEMCEIGHRIWLKGFCAGNEGNHSIRIAEDRVLCTPTGISKGFLKPDQITLVDMDGNQVDKDNKYKRTSEILLHLAIYKKRPDVKSVIHSHPPHATAFAVADVPIPEGIHPEAEVFLGKVPTAKYATPGYKEVGESVCALINADTNTVMMGNHGSVNFGPSLIEAYYKLEILDAYCRILLLTKQVGRVNALSKDQMVELLKVKQTFGMKDGRLACAPTGCVGSENDAFLASFPDPTVASATCECNSGNVVQTTGAGSSDPAFEALVQQVTSQIMATLGKK